MQKTCNINTQKKRILQLEILQDIFFTGTYGFVKFTKFLVFTMFTNCICTNDVKM